MLRRLNTTTRFNGFSSLNWFAFWRRGRTAVQLRFSVKKVNGLADLKERLIKESPNPVTAATYAIEVSSKSKPALLRAQEHEKLFWAHPDSTRASSSTLPINCRVSFLSPSWRERKK